jgi:hypothetical protein
VSKLKSKCPLRGFEECIAEDCMWYDMTYNACAPHLIGRMLDQIKYILREMKP